MNDTEVDTIVEPAADLPKTSQRPRDKGKFLPTKPKSDTEINAKEEKLMALSLSKVVRTSVQAVKMVKAMANKAYKGDVQAFKALHAAGWPEEQADKSATINIQIVNVPK